MTVKDIISNIKDKRIYSSFKLYEGIMYGISSSTKSIKSILKSIEEFENSDTVKDLDLIKRFFIGYFLRLYPCIDKYLIIEDSYYISYSYLLNVYHGNIIKENRCRRFDVNTITIDDIIILMSLSDSICLDSFYFHFEHDADIISGSINKKDQYVYKVIIDYNDEIKNKTCYSLDDVIKFLEDNNTVPEVDKLKKFSKDNDTTELFIKYSKITSGEKYYVIIYKIERDLFGYK